MYRIAVHFVGVLFWANYSLLGATYLLLGATYAAAAGPSSGDVGTIAEVNLPSGVAMIPWGKTPAEAQKIVTEANTSITITGVAAKIGDLQIGMWIKLEEIGEGGLAKQISAGQFVGADGDKVVIFQNLPEELLQRNVADWYTNEAGGIKFKVQLMRNKEDGTISGANLRPAKYQEPAGGFVFYLPPKLKGTVVNYHGAKKGATTLDADFKMAITKETVDESYFQHPSNPAKPEAGSTSGLTELTLRKLPKAKS